MTFKTIWMAGMILATGAAIGLAGCCGGETTTVKEQPIIVSPSTSAASPTVGQELQSLEDAYKKGIITRDQYEEAKKKVLERAGK